MTRTALAAVLALAVAAVETPERNPMPPIPIQNFTICNDVQRATINGTGAEFTGTGPWTLETDGPGGQIHARVTIDPNVEGAFSVQFSAQETAILIADVTTLYRIIDSTPHPGTHIIMDGEITAEPC